MRPAFAYGDVCGCILGPHAYTREVINLPNHMSQWDQPIYDAMQLYNHVRPSERPLSSASALGMHYPEHRLGVLRITGERRTRNRQTSSKSIPQAQYLRKVIASALRGGVS